MAEIALVFPGQGAQAVGMGRDLFAGDPAARSVFAEADRVLGYGLSSICFDGPAETLQATEHAQPAILTVSVAALAALRQSLGPRFRPRVAAGHSLGEYSALVAAGALAFADALRLVRERGRLMQAAGEATPGSMVAVLGLDETRLREICQQARAEGIVVVANYNAPGQLVLSGEARAVAAAAEMALEAGARRAIPLAVSGAFHSPLMAGAARDFLGALDRAPVAGAAFPVVGNVSAEPLRAAGEIRDELRRQMAEPVRWMDSVRRMSELGADLFVEVGPGAVLGGLIKRTMPGSRCLAVGDCAGVELVRRTVADDGAG